MHVYELRRGRTSAVVENVDWAKDGRWLAIGTRKRTVHVFPVNPYGGTADVASHLEGRVRNVDVIQPPLTELAPVARIRGAKASPPDQPKAPLAFIFISPVDISTSPRLRPPSSPNLTTDSPSSPLFSPQKTTNFQDVLLFDPMDGILSLRRLTLDKQLAHEPGVAASVQALGVTSISLPGMGGAGRMSGSPSMRGGGGGRMLGLTATVSVAELPMELVGKEGTVATWDLQRGRDWVEIKQPMGLDERADLRRGRLTSGDWLSEAELSTCSSSQRVLPRSLYLSHQFSFHTLGEDYHALIRGYQFDISGAKIEVRKEVEISAYSSSTRDDSAFVEGFSAPRDIRRTSSSFDEPIASAILGSFDNSNLPIILPMYPNGIPGSKPKSFRNSIPIRTMTGIGDGVTEALGRIRREMHKARSPQLVARSDSSLSGHVPLEFDEEDEDFLLRDTLAIPSQDSNEREDVSTSRDTSRGGASADSASSIATPASDSTHQLLDADVVGTVDEEIWDGWDPQDKLAVEEAEGFDDISAVGYLDEGREHIPAVSVAMSKRKGRLRRKG
ncbi:hypothetical protein B0H34DRAFT_702189 [Crassisporium funariophilum]|nr:hypothetical protein B0H34DRAFT_702189 [Crassisporium funariophilum]